MGMMSSLYPQEIGLLRSQAEGDWGRKGESGKLRTPLGSAGCSLFSFPLAPNNTCRGTEEAGI